MERTAQFKVGAQFVRKTTKRKDVETVADIYTTRNSAGEIQKIEYLVQHDFLGYTISDVIPASIIARSEIIKL